MRSRRRDASKTIPPFPRGARGRSWREGRLKNNRAKRQKLDCDKHDVTLRKLRACVRAGKVERERGRERESRIIDVYFAYSTKSRAVSVEGKQLFLVCFRLDDRRKEMKKEKGGGCTIPKFKRLDGILGTQVGVE